MLVKTINNRNLSYLNKLIKSKSLNNKGFTLVEIIVVIAIITTLALIAVPSYVDYKQKTERQVCNTNTLQFQKQYNAHLVIGDINHTEVVFEKYLEEYGSVICHRQGVISYNSGEIKCSIHNKSKRGDNEDESVPFL